jgi:cyclophilin family peptidyl-prolyl cis-trans isomerase
MTPRPAALRPSVLLAAAVVAAFAVGACSGGGPQSGGSGCPTAQPPALAAGETRTVTIETDKGAIAIKVDGSLSPVAAGNFVALAACGFYTGVVFHRVVPGFVIQGGDGQFGRAGAVNQQRVGSGGPGYTIQDEAVTATYGRGTVAMARTQAPNSQGSQFFIVLTDDARGALESANTYAIFGTVSSGMDAADAIAAAADNEIPSHPVAMTKVSVATP